MIEDNLKELEEELAQLLEARSAIDCQISELEGRIELLKARASTVPGADTLQLFPADPLPDILEDVADEKSIVSRSSSLEEKYQLFVSLFAGRPDVHARRFESKSGSKGYSPVCANQFNSSFCAKNPRVKGKANCITCSHQAFEPITLEAFEAHLSGEDPRSRDVLGAYPIDGDDRCSFIVADFDGKKRPEGESDDQSVDQSFGSQDSTANDIGNEATGLKAFETANAFRQICLAHQIPVYLEISRSGRGYHVWLFFSGQVPALLARRLFTKIWTLTMEQNPSFDFSVYDRFIPCQDTLSSHGLQGGLGNLVALPFQGKMRKSKFTSFLDTQGKVYRDQWELLSRVKRLDTQELESAISRLAKGAELGELMSLDDSEIPQKPWAKRAPTAKLSKSDFLGEVEITQANMLHIEKATLSPSAQNRIRRLAAFSNPEFYKKQRMRLSTYNEPRVIATYKEDDMYLSLPRGTVLELRSLLDGIGAKYSFTDIRNAGTALDVRFMATLRGDQPQALEAMLNHDTGVLSAGTAFGKTVVAASLIASRKINTLVLVHNLKLLEQWKAALKGLLEISNEPAQRLTPTGRKKKTEIIGEYHGAKKNCSGLVDVAMIQSLYKGGLVEDFIKDYGMVIVDEAHRVPAVSYEGVLQQVQAKYVYGLTATPSRKDGRTPILFFECGPVRYRTDAKELAKNRPFDHYMIPRFTSLQKTSVRDEKSFTALVSGIVLDADRNRLIVDDVRAALDQGRKPIILSDRTEHVIALAEELSKSCDNVITLLGKQSKLEKQEATERLDKLPDDASFVLIATGKLVGEGFDYPRLDTLFLAVPISWEGRIAQYAGRLHRIYEGKNDVHIYDYIDSSISMLDNMYHKRIKGYKAIGYQILPTADMPASASTSSFIYGKDDYWNAFQRDCIDAKKEIVISSPKIQLHQASKALSMLAAPMLKNAVLTVLTLPLEELSEKARPVAESCIGLLEEQGIKVARKPGLHQKMAIIDQEIIWYGCINLLGNVMKTDNIMRIQDSVIAQSLLAELNR